MPTKAAVAARTWTRKSYKALKRIGAPTPVAKAGANNVGRAAYKITSGKRRTRRTNRKRRRR